MLRCFEQRAGLGMSTSVAGLCQLPDLHSSTPGTYSGVVREMEESSSECARVHGLCEPCHHPRLRDTMPSANLSICCELVARKAVSCCQLSLSEGVLLSSAWLQKCWEKLASAGCCQVPNSGEWILSGGFQEISWAEWVESTEAQKSAVSAG